MPQKLHCARCGRITLHPVVVIGAQPFGRVCARKAGLVEPKRRGRASEACRDTRTLDLFGGINA
ncbi:hypothetical protein [Acidovorax kalamii]|uniref:Uncharacterized protein n=1 Tax=Acidovorax kalamii TaxID=2004485 RepID=A0A235ENV2_9BURK|nr:hypothetical protein [Acidovorax kalamii]OYD50699.1 hypothetical protein CBY09_08180 [Acidovorax kalamii]